MNERENLASYILDSLRSAGAEEAECRVTDTVKTEIYYESGKVSMVRTNFNTGISMKAIKGKRKGSVSTNSATHESIDACVAEVMESLESSIPDEAEGICEVPEVRSFSEGVEVPDKEAMYDGLRKFIDECKAKYPKVRFDNITVEHDHGTVLYRNTNGTSISESSGCYVFSPTFMAVDGDRSSSFNYSFTVFNDINLPLLGTGMTERVISESEKQIDTKPIEGKFTGDVILTPGCLESMLSSIESNFLSDGVLIDGTSIFKDSLGKQVASEILSVYSEPLNPELPNGSHTTGDGYLAENMPIIENGVLKNFTIGRYCAAKTGLKRSVSDGGNYVIPAGKESLDAIIAKTKRGLLVNRFSGGAPASNGDFTGVAKNSFLIEDGKITDAVSETMISGNLAKMLCDITDISSERVNNGDSILPWVKIANIVISGK